MQIYMLKRLFITLFVMFILASCTRDYIVPEPPPLPENPNDTIKPPDTIPENQISYSGIIQPIFTAKCVKCHGVGQALPVLTAGKSYQSLWSISGMLDTITPGNSTLYKEMKPGGGMSNYCNKSNADSVYKWIRQGAKNN